MNARRFWRMALFGKWMRAREIAHTKKDDNRIVRPFQWGLEFISDHVNGDDPRNVLREHARRAMADSDGFYSLPEIDDYRLNGDQLTWTSVIHTPSAENNIVRARLFTPRKERRNKPRAAVVVLPQWNAQPDSRSEEHTSELLSRFGISYAVFCLKKKKKKSERNERSYTSMRGRTWRVSVAN